ncbi:hypothetical protein KAI58_01685, partial [Candidatus Gracilibacteria bacterium]|nr:hypothetical protein [Candidatus Gracilibacteria bacterium]
GWDFQPPGSDTWKLNEITPLGDYYPCLSWQDNNTCPVVSEIQIEISTCEKLQKIGNDAAYPLDGKYILTQNIDCSATSGWNSGAGFDPIGDSANKFTGIFDGQGFEISDLYINRSAENYVGLFGYTYVAEIKNVGVINIDISGGNYISGLVGYNYESPITNSYSTGSVSGSGSYVGGLVGYNRSSSIDDSYSTGSVSGSSRIGSLIGNNRSSTITNSYSTGSVSGSGSYIGGLVGYGASSTIINSYSAGSVSGSDRTGGLVGYSTSSSTTNSYWNIEISGQTTSDGGIGKTTAEMGQESTYTGWSFQPPETDDWKLNEITPSDDYYPCLSWQDNNTCPVVPEIQIGISTCEELQKIGNDAAYPLDGDYILTQDIDCSKTNPSVGGSIWGVEGFDPIGTFTGIFDGQGYEVSGLYINRGLEDVVGLFGYLNTATVKNIGIGVGSVTGKDYVGGLSGISTKSIIENSYSKVTVIGNNRVGGLVGSNYHRTRIISSFSTGNVSGNKYVGGLTGYSYWWSVGGEYVNEGNETVIDSYATGDVVGDSVVGGLIGDLYYARVKKSYSIGKVTGNSVVGGLIGSGQEPYVMFGKYTFYAISDCSWDTETSFQSQGCGASDCTYAHGKTTNKMRLESTYSSWSFQPPGTATWKLNEIALAGYYYPCLSWQEDESCPAIKCYTDSDCGFCETCSPPTNRCEYLESGSCIPIGLSQGSLGYKDSCALISGGTVTCWGYDGYGQVTEASGISNVTAVTVGSYHSCALISDGTVECWGYDGQGQVNGASGISNATAVSGGNSGACALISGGTVECWGYDGNGEVSGASGISNATAVSGVGWKHYCALLSGGTVTCWGNDSYGQVSGASGISNAIAVSGGMYHSCALISDGTVECWGYDGDGRVSDASGISNATAVSGGVSHSCALISGGTVECWGKDDRGQVSGASGINNATAVSGGHSHSCAFISDGTIECWGMIDMTNCPFN